MSESTLNTVGGQPTITAGGGATQAPQELSGMNPGITVIDAGTVLRRLWYFDGKFLRAEGFRLDQQYVRSLNALTNRAVGSGVVGGFDVRLGTSDRLIVSGGLALAPSGDVVHLPGEAELPITTLVDSAQGTVAGNGAPGGGAEFGPCAVDAPSEVVVTAGRRFYVLTASSAEALCGEEERFGQLCEDACATETDRSLAVEGVRFRVRPIDPPLPTTEQPTTGVHLRNLLADAVFAWERTAVASRISRQGLQLGGVWCRGAVGSNEDEVPLAVFDRTGTVTSWLDVWTVRRELMESVPLRYWGWRFAQRPLDVFFAQVLQFQCQLLDQAKTSPDPGTTDPCADEHALLNDVLALVSEEIAVAEAPASVITDEFAEESGDSSAGRLARLRELRDQILGLGEGSTTSISGSWLFDHGFVSLPSAGYLPVLGNAPVEQYVRSMMGPGVDLRFCAVRADFIPEAFYEAQHMERISLTQGLDDPDRREEVDILVPDGRVIDGSQAVRSFEGQLHLLPNSGVDEPFEDAVVSIDVVAREHLDRGWSWALAGYGTIGNETDVADVSEQVLAKAMIAPDTDEVRAGRDLAASRVRARVAEREALRIGDAAAAKKANRAAVEAEAELVDLADRLGYHRFDVAEQPPEVRSRRAMNEAERRRMRSTRWNARARRASLRIGAVQPPPATVAPPADVPTSPLALWMDVEVDEDLATLVVGDRAPIRARVSVALELPGIPVALDVLIAGTLKVEQTTAPLGTGDPIIVTTKLTASVDPYLVLGQPIDSPSLPITDRELVWTLSSSPIGPSSVVEVTMPFEAARADAKFKDLGSPRDITAGLEFVLDLLGEGGLIDLDSFLTAEIRARLVRLELDEAPGALDEGAAGRDLGESAIDIVGSALAFWQRDGGFEPVARRRLLEADPADLSRIEASTDWVMFHRRRVKVCSDSLGAILGTRRLRWYHALAGDEFLQRLQEADAGGSNEPLSLDGLDFEPVTDLVFGERDIELRTPLLEVRVAWKGEDRGSHLAVGVVATAGVGDGGNVELGRLHTATAAVAGLVEIRGMITDVQTAIPDEYLSSGIDGVILTVGLHERG